MRAKVWFLSFIGALIIGLLLAVDVTAVQAGVPVVPNVAKNPAEVPRSPLGDVTINLEAVEVLAEIVPGTTAWVWTFAPQGGAPTIPGPMIRVREGNHVTINLCNRLGNNEPHNIDFHASMGPGGGAAVTNIEPGECKTVRFKAMRQGAYIYHCAGEGLPWEHVSYGMYGLIQVDPSGGLDPGFKEFYIGQSDWYLIANSASAEPRSFLASDVLVLDEDRALAEHPNVFTFNGHQKALTDPAIFGEKILVNQGDNVRFFFVTGGPNIGSNWHIIGTIFDKVYTGHRMTAVLNEETVYVAPGSAAVFELSAPVPGKYLLVDHALWRVPKGAAGFMHVMGPACEGETLVNPGAWPNDIFYPPACTSGH